MKSHQANGHTKKPGKRTYTLKELLQRDLAITDKLVIQNEPTETSLVDIQEDLWIEPTASGPSKQPLPQHENLAPSIERLNQLIRKEITQTALQLNLEPDELQAWIDLQVMAPKQTLLALLRLAREYSLDPLTEEVALALYENEHWQAYITVEGYSKILNRHPAFDGICFNRFVIRHIVYNAFYLIIYLYYHSYYSFLLYSIPSNNILFILFLLLLSFIFFL